MSVSPAARSQALWAAETCNKITLQATSSQHIIQSGPLRLEGGLTGTGIAAVGAQTHTEPHSELELEKNRFLVLAVGH